MNRFPAEWEPHRATWIAWPHNEEDWPEKFQCIPWVYAEIVRAIARSEFVEILCNSPEAVSKAENVLELQGVAATSYRIHECKTDRSWLRDSAPTMIESGGDKAWLKWKFNAWAKYDNFSDDAAVPSFISKASGIELLEARRPDTDASLVLEGGAIETNGAGTLLVTEECLLSSIQERNPGLSKENYEVAFRQHLGIESTIWLNGGPEGDDTHGHIDDVARFVDEQTVLLAFEENPTEDFHRVSLLNEEVLSGSLNSNGRRLKVVRLPMPRPLFFEGDRLPASYANFYITNNAVLVPTFNDVNDLRALQIIASSFPGREVIGIASTDLVLGFGALHCLSQPEFL